VSKFYFLFRFSFLDHYNSSASSLKTTTDNSSSRFNFRNENYTDCDTCLPAVNYLQLDDTEDYDNRRRIRAQIRVIRQKKLGQCYTYAAI